MSPARDNEPDAASSAYWLSWMLGAAILVAVAFAALHASEGRAFVGLAERAKPWWLLLAVHTVGIVPGGLGTFEATSVWTLNMMGVAIPIALAATLLFRGLSFWLPMVPGWWVSRRITTALVFRSL